MSSLISSDQVMKLWRLPRTSCVLDAWGPTRFFTQDPFGLLLPDKKLMKKLPRDKNKPHRSSATMLRSEDRKLLSKGKADKLEPQGGNKLQAVSKLVSWKRGQAVPLAGFVFFLCVFVLLFCKKAQKGYFPAISEFFSVLFPQEACLWNPSSLPILFSFLFSFCVLFSKFHFLFFVHQPLFGQHYYFCFSFCFSFSCLFLS